MRLTFMNTSCHTVPISTLFQHLITRIKNKRIQQSSPPFKGGESPHSRAGVVLVHTGQHHPVSCCALCAPCCHPSSTRRGTDSVTYFIGGNTIPNLHWDWQYENLIIFLILYFKWVAADWELLLFINKKLLDCARSDSVWGISYFYVPQE